jgi:serine/threonine-protein kinase
MKVTSNLLKVYGPYKATDMLDGTADMALYHALHTQSGRVVLLRVLSVRKRLNDPSVQQAMAQCVDEIGLLARIQHPNLLSVVDYGVDGKYIYMAYPSLSGQHLAELLYGKHTAPPDPDVPLLRLPSLGETARLLSEVGAALQAIHDADQVHGQLEPHSIFIEGDTAYVADAGLLRLQKYIFQLDATSSFSMTRYSAPEVWQADRAIAASDQYALACLAYELVTGLAPFESPTILGLMNAHLNDMPAPPHRVRPDLNLPAELSFVFWQALAKTPEDRFPSVMAFVDAFTQLIRGREGAPSTFFDALS